MLLVVLIRRQRGGILLLPALVSDTFAAAAFTVAGFRLLATGVDAVVVSHGDGAGQWLSAAPIALAAAAAFGLRLIRDLQDPEVISDQTR